MRHITTCLVAAALTAHAYAQCTSFQPAYPGLNGAVRAFASWNGSATGTPALVAGGEFTWDGEGSQDYIAYWDGEQWAWLGWGTDGPVNAITVWDPDGSGPLPEQLIIAGEFTHVGSDSTGELAANHIARWDGEAWRPLGAGIDGPVYALTLWDPDGTGPWLIAAGDFHNAGGSPADYVAAWDGASWSVLGWGFDGPAHCLTTWDPDGPGPLDAQLAAGGDFLNAGADDTGQIEANGIALWDGTIWRGLGAGFPGDVRTVTTFDFDGAGAQLVAGGPFGVQRWAGEAWQSVGPSPLALQYLYFQSYRIMPLGPKLCGPRTGMAQGTATSLLAMGQGAGAQLYAAAQITFFDPLCIDYEGGHHGSNADVTQQVVLVWDGSAWTEVVSPRLPITLLAAFDANGSGAQLAIVAGSGDSPYVYSCAPPSTCGTADFNCDGDVGTDSDINAFFACLSGTCPAAPCTNSADFNGDGDVGTDADIEAFFRVLAGGSC